MNDHDDRVRGFPAFGRQPRGARFAGSWWGGAWIEAMEHTSLDKGRLSRGRTYARTGHVDSITISPGLIAAAVHGSESEPYQTSVAVELLSDNDWERFIEEIAATAGHIAALLDHDMPPELVAAAADAGVRLLPGVGDLEPECTCLDWGYPCKHAAALCYQVSWLLDANPFVLLQLRGRGECELLAELQRRNAEQAGTGVTREGEPTGSCPVVDDASTAFATEPAALPDPPTRELATAPPLRLPATPEVDVAALGFLAADAADRARQLLDGAPAPVLDTWQDTVRIAATCREESVLTRLARNATSRDDLARAATAWSYGRSAGLDTLERPWTPARVDLAHAWEQVRAGWDAERLPAVRAWRNRWTVEGTHVQIRYGRDGRWYPYRRQSGRWWPAGPPDADPAALLTDLLGH